MSAHQLIIGGQRSGKSRHAERLALRWAARTPTHRVTVIATAEAHDDEMREASRATALDRPAGASTPSKRRCACASAAATAARCSD